MRVMASQTAKFVSLIAALLKTPAAVHLFHLPHRPLRVYSVRRKHKKGNKIGESQTRTKILAFSVSFDSSNHRLKMTLLADTFARDRIQTFRIHDGVVHPVDLLATFSSMDMQFSRPMTPFATNGVTLKNRSLEMVDRAVNRLGSIRMAINAFVRDRPREMLVVRAIVGRQVP